MHQQQHLQKELDKHPPLLSQSLIFLSPLGMEDPIPMLSEDSIVTILSTRENVGMKKEPEISASLNTSRHPCVILE